MHSSITAIVLLFLGTLLASETSLSAKHCGRRPAHCCGCDLSKAKRQVRWLWNRWSDLISREDDDIPAAAAMFYPEAEVFITSEGIETPCCTTRVNSTVAMEPYEGNWVLNLDLQVELLRNGTVMTEHTLMTALQNITSFAYHYTMWWNPDENCQYKIAYAVQKSYACPLCNYLSCDA